MGLDFNQRIQDQLTAVGRNPLILESLVDNLHTMIERSPIAASRLNEETLELITTSWKSLQQSKSGPDPSNQPR